MAWRSLDLVDRNALALPARARHFAAPDSEENLRELLVAAQGAPLTIIGAGSNLVLDGDIPGYVLQPALGGIRVVKDDASAVTVEVGAGENWDQLVAQCVARGWHGLENLSLIPGSAGAAPYQNIGAYGVELADRLESLDAMDVGTGQVRSFSAEECAFAYRDSLFKSGQPGRWVIMRLRLRLAHRFAPQLDYADLRQRYSELPVSRQNAAGLRELIIRIRQDKLPDPAVLPNAGSFFKNPEVSTEAFHALRERFPDLVAYALADGRFKLAAGWLIEKAGWKGRRLGSVGMHDRQALVLVNYGGGTAAQVRALQEAVQGAVRERFGVELEREPVWLPRERAPG